MIIIYISFQLFKPTEEWDFAVADRYYADQMKKARLERLAKLPCDEGDY